MKEYKGKSGIYKIVNDTNNKIYIGKTKNFYKRYYQYKNAVTHCKRKRINEYLMNAFLKYGFENFTFEVVEFCNNESLSERELFWMDNYQSYNRKFGYNLRRDSSSGVITHPETSKKISERLKKEWKEGIRNSHSDKLKLSWESRDKMLQSDLLSKTLTKYVYIVNGVNHSYKDLCEKGLKNVLSKFFRLKTDEVIFKDKYIKRVRINESQT